MRDPIWTLKCYDSASCQTVRNALRLVYRWETSKKSCILGKWYWLKITLKTPKRADNLRRNHDEWIFFFQISLGALFEFFKNIFHKILSHFMFFQNSKSLPQNLLTKKTFTHLIYELTKICDSQYRCRGKDRPAEYLFLSIAKDRRKCSFLITKEFQSVALNDTIDKVGQVNEKN